MRSASKQINWWQSTVSEPYRVFFPLGIFWAFWGISHWLFYALNWIPVYSMQLHSHIQIHAYIGCFITGFLLTALPRFASAPPANFWEFSAFFVLVNAAPLLYHQQAWIAGRLCFALWLLLLALFAGRRFLTRRKDSNIKPPTEFVWIPAGLLCGFTGTLLLTGSDLHWFYSPANLIGKLLIEQGFLLSIVVGVGSFMGPRLMGTFRPLFKVQDPASQKTERKKALLIQLLAIGLLILSFVAEGLKNIVAGYALRTAVIAFIYFRARALVVKPLTQEPFVRMLWVSFWMILSGHAAVVLFPAYRAALLHIAFIGGYSLMTFAVGLMVIFSHGGQTRRLKSHAVSLSIVSALVGIALILRVSAVYFPELFFALLAAASVCWLLGGALWMYLVSGALFGRVSAEEFERCHEEAKQRVQSLRSNKPIQ